MTASAQNITVVAAGAPFTYASRNGGGTPAFVVAVPGEDIRSTLSLILEPFDAMAVFQAMRDWFESDEVIRWLEHEEAREEERQLLLEGAES